MLVVGNLGLSKRINHTVKKATIQGLNGGTLYKYVSLHVKILVYILQIFILAVRCYSVFCR